MVAIGLLGWALGVAVVTEPGTRLPPGGVAHAQAQGIAQLVGGDTDEESGIFLPTDRLRERQLDQARQAIAAGGFSDASTVIDDILASDSDSFLRSDEGAATWTSVKAEAAALLDAMPAAGRDAYELQFRAKAERQLQAALESDDREAVVAVARRWFHTPAGRSAAVMTALDCLATGQPLSAQAWLERLARQEAADRFEPSLSLMRALAARDAGDRETAEAMVAEAVRRAGGARLRLGATPLEQLLEDSPLAAASSGRAVDADLSRPLLVPRFRVPLTRHPGEARLLTRQRLAARDRQRPLLPAGTPLVIDDTVVLRTPLGLLGVDRATGKRIWLQPGRFDDDTGLASLGETGDAEGGRAGGGPWLRRPDNWQAGKQWPAAICCREPRGGHLGCGAAAGRAALWHERQPFFRQCSFCLRPSGEGSARLAAAASSRGRRGRRCQAAAARCRQWKPVVSRATVASRQRALCAGGRAGGDSPGCA